MFDPTLTIDSGIERLGEVLDGRAIELPPNHPVILYAQRYRAGMQYLIDNGQMFNGSFGLQLSLHASRNSQALYEQIKKDPADELLALAPLRFRSAILAHSSVREAILNVLDHGSSEGCSFRHLVGSGGEFFVIAQETAGPPLERILLNQQNGTLSNYLSGSVKRGCGFRNLASSQNVHVWYASPLEDHSYALLIFAPTDGEVLDSQNLLPIPTATPTPVKWSPKPGTLDARLWDALVNCDAGIADPLVYYADFFRNQGLSLEEALLKMDPRVQALFEMNVEGILENASTEPT
jgi:hypothetical protein